MRTIPSRTWPTTPGSSSFLRPTSATSACSGNLSRQGALTKTLHQQLPSSYVRIMHERCDASQRTPHGDRSGLLRRKWKKRDLGTAERSRPEPLAGAFVESNDNACYYYNNNTKKQEKNTNTNTKMREKEKNKKSK
jgi:hypothetical protein